MTEKEVFDLQEQGGNQEYFLILVGSFLHAYGHGAFVEISRFLRQPQSRAGRGSAHSASDLTLSDTEIRRNVWMFRN